VEKYMSMGIKALIDDLPEVGEILGRYDIGCVKCLVGTCKLEDVIKIHTLAPSDEAALLAEIEKAIYPDREVAQQPARREPEAPKLITYSPPVRKLVDEHKWIMRLLALLPAMLGQMQARGEIDCERAREVLDFIRTYADRFHHMKEEDILFDYTDKEADVIQVILQDHLRGRALVRAAAEAIESGKCSELASSLEAYRELLTEHIAKEDDILYPYIERNLTTAQVEEMSRRFEEAESGQAADTSERYQKLVTDLEREYPGKE